jgi:nucleotide-binding universal stress UspA family protein
MKRILFPVDYSAQCVAAASHVAAFSKILGTEVVLLHTVMPLDCLHGAPEMYAATAADLAKWQRQADVDRLNGFLPGQFPGAARVIGSGDPAHDIVSYAEDDSFGLIMLPTHGLGRFRRLLIGSVTAKILHDTNVPVWTAVHAQEQCDAPPEYRKVLYACDLGPESVNCLRWAADFAGRAGAKLEVVHAVQAAEARPEKYFDLELVATLAKEARDRISTMLDEDRIQAVIHTRGGRPASVVREVAGETHADLLVIGRGALSAGLGRLWAHGYALIGSSPCPVVSV